jgi:hypothetical protein
MPRKYDSTGDMDMDGAALTGTELFNDKGDDDDQLEDSIFAHKI